MLPRGLARRRRRDAVVLKHLLRTLRRPAVRRQADESEYPVDAAEIHRRAGRLARACELCERALALRPDDGRAWQVRGTALEELGLLEEATQCLRQELRLRPDDVNAHSNLLHMLNRSGQLPPAAVTAEHVEWAKCHADRLTPARAEFSNSADPERVLRIGYVSADFRRHAAACFIEPVLREHRRERFEVYCYSNWDKPDAVSARLRAYCAHWRDIAGVDDDAAAQMVRDDRIDILVDLSGHTHGNRLLLFARKPAPLQAGYMGYLGTSGMAAMDLHISDAQIDPPGAAEPLYRERLLRLPHGVVCYQPSADAPAVNALPALQQGHVTFGSFNNFLKITDATKRAWARLLARLPEARLRMVGVWAGEACDRMLEIFETEGVYADRIDVAGRLPYAAYLEQYRHADIALDPHPYNGGTTTLESLWMGLPVVTLAGSPGFPRCAASHLHNLGLDDLIANSWDEYIDIAARLAADVPRLAALRSGLRARMRDSALLDAAGFTAALESLYRQAWREWCAGAAQAAQTC